MQESAPSAPLVASARESEARLKVLFVSACVGKGGAGHSLRYLCGHLDREVVEPIVVLPNDGVIGSDLRENGIETLNFPRLRERFYELRFKSSGPLAVAASWALNAWDSVVFVFQLARLARRRRVDAIYGNHMMVKVIVTLSGLLSRRPAFLHCRTIYSNAAERALYVSFAALPHVRRIIAVSNASAENFRAVAGKVRVVRNGVPIDEVTASAEGSEVRSELGIPSDHRVVGFVGRLVGWKGLDVFLDAAARVSEDRDDVTFVVVGDVPTGSATTLDEFRDQARERGLAGRVMFVGFQARPEGYVRSFDVLAVPSTKPDPCPRSVIESMALGTPVIGADHGGISELIEHGTTGLLVPPGDAEALADAMRELVDDDAMRERFSAASVRRAREEHDASVVASRIQAHLVDAMQVEGSR